MAENTKSANPSDKMSKPSTDTAAAEPSKKNASDDTQTSQLQQDLEKQHQSYLETVSKLYQEASTNYLQLMGSLAEELRKIQQDAVKSDPSSAFAIDVLRAYKTQDLKALADAHRTLSTNLQKTASTASKRIVQAIKGTQSEYTALRTALEKALRDSADGYSKGVLQSAKNVSADSFDRNFVTALGHGLLLSAMVAPNAGQSEAA